MLLSEASASRFVPVPRRPAQFREHQKPGRPGVSCSGSSGGALLVGYMCSIYTAGPQKAMR
jgi:hypothetical protein